MLIRIMVGLLLSSSALAAWAIEVSTIVACQPEGEVWLCAAYENEEIQVFRSEQYISKVEFVGDDPQLLKQVYTNRPVQVTLQSTSRRQLSPGASSAKMLDQSIASSTSDWAHKMTLKSGVMESVKMGSAASVTSADQLPDAKFTLQLVACSSNICRQRTQHLQHIPGSQRVDIKYQGKLWEVLIIGGYPTLTAAQSAAADLIQRHNLKDKPWVRSVQSIRSRLVAG